MAMGLCSNISTYADLLISLSRNAAITIFTPRMIYYNSLNE